MLLTKGVYPYEYMDSWERFDEALLHDKKSFYSKLNLEHITDKDYKHAQKLWEVFGIKNLGEYHDLYVQSRYIIACRCIWTLERYVYWNIWTWSCSFFSEPGLAWQVCLKKAIVNLELSTDIDMLLMVEKGIRSRICQAIHRNAKVSNKYMSNYNKEVTSNLSGWLAYLVSQFIIQGW